MTEAEWLAATDPTPMLEFLRDRVTDRKMLLYCVECFYISQRTKKRKNAPDVECVARLADGADNLEEVRGHWLPANLQIERSLPKEPFNWCSAFLRASLTEKSVRRQKRTFPTVAELVALFREVFGNPFRSVTVDPSWLTSDVRLLSSGIYERKAFVRMPILADALQDAGCDDILNLPVVAVHTSIIAPEPVVVVLGLKNVHHALAQP